MCIALGNKKPEQLLEVEKLIWQALLTLSEGKSSPEDVMGDLLKKIPWDKLLTISQPDSEWFLIQAPPAAATEATPESSSTFFENDPMDDSNDYQEQRNNDTHSEGRAASAERVLTPTGSQASNDQSATDDQSVIYCRSTRLALEKNKEESLPSTSPKRRTSHLKRKAPTGDADGDADVEELLSAEGSRGRPIDVDALQAVLERYPVKREPQVCAWRTFQRNVADEFISY